MIRPRAASWEASHTCDECGAVGPVVVAQTRIEAVTIADREAVRLGWCVNGPILCPSCRRPRQLAAGVLPLAGGAA